MLNQAMQRALNEGSCLDVMVIGEEIGPGLYSLREFTEGKDYCDADQEAWIWSIGRNRKTGEIQAATDSRFYQNPDYHCLWIR